MWSWALASTSTAWRATGGTCLDTDAPWRTADASLTPCVFGAWEVKQEVYIRSGVEFFRVIHDDPCDGVRMG